jgi:hypothetical protein
VTILATHFFNYPSFSQAYCNHHENSFVCERYFAQSFRDHDQRHSAYSYPFVVISVDNDHWILLVVYIASTHNHVDTASASALKSKYQSGVIGRGSMPNVGALTTFHHLIEITLVGLYVRSHCAITCGVHSFQFTFPLIAASALKDMLL